jgi:hypothetical protein
MKSTIIWDITPCSPLKISDFSEEHITSIITLVSCLTYSALKMEVVCSSETSVDFNGLHGVICQKTILFCYSWHGIIENDVRIWCLQYVRHYYVPKVSPVCISYFILRTTALRNIRKVILMSSSFKYLYLFNLNTVRKYDINSTTEGPIRNSNAYVDHCIGCSLCVYT